MRMSDAYLRQYTNQHCFRQWLAPGRCQAISWTNAEIFLTGPSVTKFSDFFLSKFIHYYSRNASENVVWKMPTILSRAQCVNTKWKKVVFNISFLIWMPPNRVRVGASHESHLFYLWSSVLGDIPFGMEFEQIRRYSKFHGPLNVTKYNVRQCCRLRTY